MKHYTILPHTADLRLLVKSETLHELFEAALQGMSEVLKPGGCKGFDGAAPGVSVPVMLNAADTTALLIDFLSEALTHSYINHAVFCAITFEHLTETELNATLRGIPVPSFDEDIKAVTYHQAAVGRDEQGDHCVTIVFDI